MSMDVPSASQSSRPLKVTVNPAPGTVVLGNADPFTAAVQVPVARVPVSELIKESVEVPSVSPFSVEDPARSDEASGPDQPTIVKEHTEQPVKARPPSSAEHTS